MGTWVFQYLSYTLLEADFGGLTEDSKEVMCGVFFWRMFASNSFTLMLIEILVRYR